MGNVLNNMMGVTSSAKQAYRYNMNLQHDAQNFAQWQMANAHQMEVQDLMAAGLNPALSAGGSGASAGVSANSTGSGTGAGVDPFSMASQIINMMNSTKQTNAVVDKTEAETDNIKTDTDVKKQVIQWTPELNRALIKLQNATSSKQDASASKDLQDVLESQARTQAQQIMNQMMGMDLTKRKKYFETELEIKRKQMQAELVSAGFESSQIYQAIDRAFATAGKIFTGSVSYNYGHNTSYSNSNVNVHNADYNPERKAKIGF